MTIKMVPPDGGWGWMVMMASALSNIMTISIMQGSGLIFKERFSDLGITIAEGSIIMSVNSGLGLTLALFTGPLLKRFGFRKVCIVGSICYSSGVLLTAFATRYIEMLLTYGVLTSIGMNLIMASFMMGLNAYFTKKKSRAVGLMVTITGLGPIIMPQIISFSSEMYGKQMTMLILGGLSLHTIVSALLLHPVEWHMKRIEVDDEDEIIVENIERDMAKISPTGSFNRSDGGCKRNESIKLNSIDCVSGYIYSFETDLPAEKTKNIALTTSNKDQQDCTRLPTGITGEPGRPSTPTERYPSYKWWSSGTSFDTVNLGSSVKIFDDKAYHRLSRAYDNDDAPRNEKQLYGNPRTTMEKVVEIDDEESEIEPVVEKPSRFRALVMYFDFDLLQDPVFVHILVGMSLALTAEIYFTIMTPFVLIDMHFSTEEAATAMSTSAFLDFITRGLTPFVGERLKQPSRNLYLYGLLMAISSRMSLMFASNFFSIICCAVAIGIARAMPMVYMPLVICDYVSSEKLPSATGLQLLCSGTIMLSIGPFLGIIQGSQGVKMFIAAVNSLTALTVVMWLMEMCIRRFFKKKKPEGNAIENKPTIMTLEHPIKK